MPDFRSLVSFTDPDGRQHSVDITAWAFSKLRSSPMNAMKVPDWFKRSALTIEILVKQTEPFDHHAQGQVPGCDVSRKPTTSDFSDGFLIRSFARSAGTG